MKPRDVASAAASFAAALVAASLPIGTDIFVALGGARGPLVMSGLAQTETAMRLPDSEATGARRTFYFRRIVARSLKVDIPLVSNGPVSVAVRAHSTVRTRLSVFRAGQAAGEGYVPPGPWSETVIASGVPGPLVFDIALEDAPLVRRGDVDNFRRYVDGVVARSAAGFSLPWTARIASALAVAMFAAALANLVGPIPSLLASIVAVAGLRTSALADPIAVALASPRLVPFALFAAVTVAAAARPLGLPSRARAFVGLLGALAVTGYGFLPFLENHAPPDLDIHIWRTLDLARVAPSYEAWLRYGSHYPTPSQIRGAATEALGLGPMIPYSPLPYVVFYFAHAAGLQLQWALYSVLALSIALLLPVVFAFAARACPEGPAFAGTVACLLVALDLALGHRLGRAHAPAVLGAALGIAGFLLFGLALLRRPKADVRLGALALGIGALGYSSTPVVYALFGIAVVAALAAQRETRALAAPAALALAFGGCIALGLYYGHYVPGLLGGGVAGPAEDAFPGSRYLIFGNESRQSLRLWRLGLLAPLAAAVPALVFARCGNRAPWTLLVAWCSAWAGIMMLKEPWGLPILLRWAKEDLYVTTGAALAVGLAVARVRRPALQRALAVGAIAGALVLRARDYGFHADTLRFLQ